MSQPNPIRASTIPGLAFGDVGNTDPVPAGTFGAGGAGLPATFQAKTADYTAQPGDFVLADATAAALTITLPSNPVLGALVAVKKIDATANIVTIAPAGAGSIDGSPTATTATRWAGAIFEHAGSDVWRIATSMSTTGPQGIQGIQGIQGPQGIQGLQGTPSGGQLPRKELSGRWDPATGGGSLATMNLDDGYEFAFPFEVFEATTYQALGLNVQSLNAAASIRLGVRQNNNGVPGALVAEGATQIDASAATGVIGDKTVAFAQTLQAGVYWLVARSAGGIPNVRATVNLPVLIGSTTTAGAMNNICCGYNNGGGSSGVLPNAWGATVAHQTTVPRVCRQVA